MEILKENYGDNTNQYAIYRYIGNTYYFHMSNNKTLIFDSMPDDSDLKIIAIYGIN